MTQFPESTYAEIYEDTESYRDHIGTVDESGKRRWMFPRKPKGRFYRWRTWVSWICLGLLFIGPFLRWNGQPLLLFNFLERKFIVFGLTFWPQDFHLFVLAMITLFVFIVLFTVIFGRIWCGWVCPQTVFMEMVFRKIEYWIEGSHIQQKKLAEAPWTSDKILKKGSKWVIFYLFSFLIANTLMAYIVGIEELSKIVTESPWANAGKFTFVMIFSGIFFFVFAYFREQACIVVCPYGRLQGVLLDRDSIVVAYDWIRGEPRGKRRKAEKEKTESLGDCIDCKLCVQVCPTGIDIRDGTQMECVNCTACIDACDGVMDKIHKPRGLIRFASYRAIAEGLTFRMTPRIWAYSSVLAGLLVLQGFLLGGRSPVEATLLRPPGALYNRIDDQHVANVYNLQVINKSRETLNLELQLIKPIGTIKLAGNQLLVQPQDIAKASVVVELPDSVLDAHKNTLIISVRSDGHELERIRTNFLGPMRLRGVQRAE